MGAFSEVLHALLIPAGIAIVLYVSLSFVILPAVRRYRSRYDQYIPLQTVTDRVAAGTSTLRDRVADFITRIVLPRTQRIVNATSGRRESLNELYNLDLEEGEEMEDFIERAEAWEDGSNDTS
ncbi:hypothetical protein C1H76_3360 [Elsinoe australis]|uniref:Uncharacterized protein n=1 Tax=Elsinoe australis TaxID=40998 RepID=A0A4U7B088_9PEZI|nr:hypothetical protein C1H76_3360 [Elsinoe australis]